MDSLKSNQSNHQQNDSKWEIILAHIFNHLNLNDSTDRATMNLLASAIKFQTKKVLVDNSGFVRYKHNVLGEKLNTVSNIETTTFLRECGHLLTKLQLDYSNRNFLDDTNDMLEIERALAHYCVDSLIEFKVLCFDAFTFNGIDIHDSVTFKPFRAVTKVSIVDGHFEQSLANLCNLFPNAEHLMLVNNIFSDRKHIEFAFPSLKQLTLKHNRSDQLGQLQWTNITSFLHLNGQLQCLCLMASSISMNTRMLSCINQTLPNLIDLTFELLGDKDLTDEYIVNFNALKKLRVYLPKKRQCQVPLSAEYLEELWLIGYSASNVQWTNFITKCTNLYQLMLLPGLTIMTAPIATEIILPKENLDKVLMIFAKNLRSLNVLHVFGDFISTPNQLNQFVNECETLRTLDLGFRYSDQIVRESFASALGNDWQVIIHEPHIDYHRITLKY